MFIESNFKVVGEFRDTIIYKDGRKEVLEWNKNIIVRNLGILVARMLKGDPQAGIGYWAIGSGNSSWDVVPVEATVEDVALVAEFVRKIIPAEALYYIDDNNLVSVSPTNRLEIVLTFEYIDAVGSWREFAIFAGSATATLNSGTNINKKNHGRIDKTADMTIIRQMRFTFVNT